MVGFIAIVGCVSMGLVGENYTEAHSTAIGDDGSTVLMALRERVEKLYDRRG